MSDRHRRPHPADPACFHDAARNGILPRCFACSHVTAASDIPRRGARCAPWARRVSAGTDAVSEPRVSFIIASRNRRDVLLDTLRRVHQASTFSGPREVIVVDNASSDGTASAVQTRFSGVTLLALPRNLGSCAKALGVERARGRYIVFLDDDSYPRPGTIDRMIEHFRADDRLGAAGFLVHLPDGRLECSAFPNVFVGCGVGLRADALRAVGGLDRGLFMQAEEFDLSFRLINAAWHVETFADLHVDHLKTPRARLSARTTYCDTRNNLLIVERYLNEPSRRVYREDWLRRYYWLALGSGHRIAFARARIAASLMGPGTRRRYADRRLRPAAFERLFRWRDVRSRMTALRRDGVTDLVLADLGKNIFAFYRAARDCGLSIRAVADDRFAAVARRYRGIPIVPTPEIPAFKPDAVVVSNTAPVHAAATRLRLEASRSVPVYDWFGASSAPRRPDFLSTDPSVPTDKPAESRPSGVTLARRTTA